MELCCLRDGLVTLVVVFVVLLCRVGCISFAFSKFAYFDGFTGRIDLVGCLCSVSCFIVLGIFDFDMIPG